MRRRQKTRLRQNKHDVSIAFFSSKIMKRMQHDTLIEQKLGAQGSLQSIGGI